MNTKSATDLIKGIIQNATLTKYIDPDFGNAVSNAVVVLVYGDRSLSIYPTYHLGDTEVLLYCTLETATNFYTTIISINEFIEMMAPIHNVTYYLVTTFLLK